MHICASCEQGVMVKYVYFVCVHACVTYELQRELCCGVFSSIVLLASFNAL